MQQIMQLAEPLNATQVVAGGSNVDSGPWGQAGVPFGAPMIANQVMRRVVRISLLVGCGTLNAFANYIACIILLQFEFCA